MVHHADRGNGASLVELLCSMGIDIRSERFSDQIGGLLEDLREKEGDDRLTPAQTRVRAFLETFGDFPQALRLKALELSAQLEADQRPALDAALAKVAQARFPTDRAQQQAKVSQLANWKLPQG